MQEHQHGIFVNVNMSNRDLICKARFRIMGYVVLESSMLGRSWLGCDDYTDQLQWNNINNYFCQFTTRVWDQINMQIYQNPHILGSFFIIIRRLRKMKNSLQGLGVDRLIWTHCSTQCYSELAKLPVSLFVPDVHCFIHSHRVTGPWKQTILSKINANRLG